MGDLLFVIRTFFVTVVVVLILQVKIGDFTLEERSMNWVRSSVFVGYLQEVANGSIVLMDRGVQKIKALMSSRNPEVTKNSDNTPGHRSLINLERSKEFLTEKAELARRAVSEAADKTAEKVNEFQDHLQDEVEEDAEATVLETEE